MTALPSPLASITLEDNVTHVIETIRRVREFGPVVLVGTSGGGATISVVGNRVPELIAGIVYVSGGCCVELPGVAAYLANLGHQLSARRRFPGEVRQTV
ncbi:alpha/beta fold hydrolase [Nocardia asteroides]